MAVSKLLLSFLLFFFCLFSVLFVSVGLRLCACKERKANEEEEVVKT